MEVNEKLISEFIHFANLDDDTVDDNKEISLITMLLNSAVSSAKEAGVKEEYTSKDNDYYKLLLFSTAAHWYDNRGVMTTSYSAKGIPMSSMWILQQLR